MKGCGYQQSYGIVQEHVPVNFNDGQISRVIRVEKVNKDKEQSLLVAQKKRN